MPQTYRVVISNPEGKIMRTLYVLADNPTDASDWGHDWLDAFSARCGIGGTGWKIDSYTVPLDQ